MPTPCPLCRVFFPDIEPRLPHHPQVCDADRRRVDQVITDIGVHHATLVNPPPLERTTGTYAARDRLGRLTGELIRRDPVAGTGGAGPVPSPRLGQRVSGSRDPHTPTNLDRIDLLSPSRSGTVRETAVPAVTIVSTMAVSRQIVVETHQEHTTVDGVPAVRQRRVPVVRERQVPISRRIPARDTAGCPVTRPSGDQIGHQPAATVLDQWVRNWRDELAPDCHLPQATVPDLVAWLLAYAQIACDQFDGIADCVAELRRLRGALREAAGEAEPRPKLLLGRRCRRCSAVSKIVWVDGERYAECRGCGSLFTSKDLAEDAGNAKMPPTSALEG